MPRVSNYTACAVGHDQIYLAQLLDKLEYPSRFARMTLYDGRHVRKPWTSHDLEWKVESVCVWRDGPFGNQVCVTLSSDGDVELLGLDTRPPIVERILDRITGPGSGVAPPRELFGMRRVRQIGRRLYACGFNNQLLRRDGEGWEVITSPALAAEAKAANLSVYDLNGPDETSIYAVGSSVSTKYRIAFFDGSDWRDLATSLPDYMGFVSVSERGGVYITGWNGLLLYGDHKRGFAQFGSNRIQGAMFRPVEFGGILYIANQTGLFTVAGPDQPVRRAVTGLDPELMDTITLDVADGVLWVVGRKDLACFDGHTWTRVHDPANPRIGVDVFEFNGTTWKKGRGRDKE